MSIQTILSHLATSDPVLASVIPRIPPLSLLEPVPWHEYCMRLCREIVYQQLSNKAGDAIWGRFEKAVGTHEITAESILRLSHEEIRAVGVSNAKARYIHNIAQAVHDESIPFETFPKLTDEEIIISLTQIKGVGRWTAEMFLMFSLVREDVFSHGDQGLRRAIHNLYSPDKELTKGEIDTITEKWSPYRTYACWILWRSLE